MEETKWIGKTTRQLGNGCKLFYSGYGKKTNGVGTVLRMKMTEKVVEVDRYSDRTMRVNLTVAKELWNAMFVYTPQVGRPWEEKESFVEELEDMIRYLEMKH